MSISNLPKALLALEESRNSKDVVYLAKRFNHGSINGKRAFCGEAVIFPMSPEMVGALRMIQDALQPGELASGVDAIEVDARSYLHVWTHDLTDTMGEKYTPVFGLGLLKEDSMGEWEVFFGRERIFGFGRENPAGWPHDHDVSLCVTPWDVSLRFRNDIPPIEEVRAVMDLDAIEQAVQVTKEIEANNLKVDTNVSPCLNPKVDTNVSPCLPAASRPDFLKTASRARTRMRP